MILKENMKLNLTALKSLEAIFICKTIVKRLQLILKMSLIESIAFYAKIARAF